MTFSSALIKATVLFPLNVMGIIPALILWFSGKFDSYQISSMPIFSGGFLISVGFYVCWISVSLFTDYGEGTPAPWAPPKNLVKIGMYSYVRNPMMIGVWCILIGEANLFMSFEVLVWFFIFFLGSIILVPLWEEVDLERRFGESYREYKKQIPRWIPKIKLLF